ncbi:O-antigen ligase family protein [Vibrio fluvialis]|nr:O-antigen ligase family protein [Vibrio fluvialis]
MNFCKSKSILYCYFPLLFLLLPTFPNITGAGDYIVFLFAVSFVCIAFALARTSIVIPVVPSTYFVFMLACLSWALFLDAYNGVIGYSDISEVIKVCCYYLFFLYFYNAKLKPGELLSLVVKLIVIFSMFAVIFNFLDVFSLAGFRNISYLLYKRESVLILNNKAISPFFTTYNFAAFMVLPLSFFFLCAFNLNKFSQKFISAIGFVAIFFVIMLSQSRSSLVTIFVALFLLLLLVINLRRTLMLGFLFILIVAGFIYNFERLNELVPYLFEGVENILQGNNNSVNYRQSQIKFVIDNTTSPFGFGVSKSLYMFESLYSLYPSRYGLLFTLIFLFTCVFISYLFFIHSKYVFDNKGHKSLLLALGVWFITYPISGLSSAHHDTTKFSFFFYGFVGLALYLNRVHGDRRPVPCK